MKTHGNTSLKKFRCNPTNLAKSCGALVASSLIFASSAPARQSVPDEQISNALESALLFETSVPSYLIDVSVTDGIATLGGTVSNVLAKERAVKAAKSIRGVRSVIDEIIHRYDTERPDSEIATEVRRAFEIDILLRPWLIDVEVNDNIVELRGTVGSAAEKDRAKTVAWVKGVKEVNAEKLEVDSWASSENLKKELPAIKDDERIKQAVLDTFTYDPRVFSFNPEVSVSNGVVTLTGIVDNLKAKQAAERDARNTVGVWRVKNLLKVRTPEPIADETIETNLETALAFNGATESHEIGVEVENGIATLSGTVDSFLERNEAADVASRTNGVIIVRNNLDVDYPELTYYSYSSDPLWSTPAYYGYNKEGEPTWPTVSDAEIIEEIEDQFFWSPFVDGEGINIFVDRGEATLTGTVDDYSEYRDATENAYEGGAKAVINKLDIE